MDDAKEIRELMADIDRLVDIISRTSRIKIELPPDPEDIPTLLDTMPMELVPHVSEATVEWAMNLIRQAATKEGVMQPIGIGRIVHYVMDNQGIEEVGRQNAERPAIIVETWGHEFDESGAINLMVLTDNRNDHGRDYGMVPTMNGEGNMEFPSVMWKTSVSFSEEKKPGTWHWPERK
jgi:hypothetical protein